MTYSWVDEEHSSTLALLQYFVHKVTEDLGKVWIPFNRSGMGPMGLPFSSYLVM